MDYVALKIADAALGIDDPGQAAATLNASTVEVAVDIATADARSVLLLSGEWFKVKQLAKQPLSGTTPPTPMDQAIAAADICVDTLTLTDVLHTSNPGVWQAMQPMMGALRATVVSAESVAAWVAMRNQKRRVFPEDVTGADIIAARNYV